MPASPHWAAIARQWGHQGPPLRPHPDDIALMSAAAASAVGAGSGERRLLLLGVTQEIATAEWPFPARLFAADHAFGMISALWPGNRPARQVACADWRRLPLADGSMDVALGDGCLSAMPFPQPAREFSREVRRVLKQDGLLVLRLFCRPAATESVEDVNAALRDGRIGSPHVFRWRLAMAVQGDDPARGARLSEIWDAYRAMVPDAVDLTRRFGWPAEALALFEHYRARDARYSFPSIEEVVQAMPEFSLFAAAHGRYELAERCPVVSLRRR